ncbi:hypothetical protein EBT16_11350 [bacterium]|nr:hypothetical protein [bacterium]
MQEFLFIPYDTSATREVGLIESRYSHEELISSPEKMYMLSLSIRDRLPENLHNAMLLWSFDPNNSHYVQMYLDWSSHCEEMKRSKERFDIRCKTHDRIMLSLMVVTGLAIFSTLVSGVIK